MEVQSFPCFEPVLISTVLSNIVRVGKLGRQDMAHCICICMYRTVAWVERCWFADWMLEVHMTLIFA